ncbi:unnamed protein product [Trichogramma brassicae]|uniref:Uncharacterized protein n=1 Tax=Trichogramma brassicae TaxID=86971 RepID=A0A6H5I923_9HYME|nr:unnamed protein product [Trichogramma brassicae]
MRARVSTTQAAQFIGIPWKILASLRGEPLLGGPPSTRHPCSSMRVSIRLTLWANVQLMLCLLLPRVLCVCIRMLVHTTRKLHAPATGNLQAIRENTALSIVSSTLAQVFDTPHACHKSLERCGISLRSCVPLPSRCIIAREREEKILAERRMSRGRLRRRERERTRATLMCVRPAPVGALLDLDLDQRESDIVSVSRACESIRCARDQWIQRTSRPQGQPRVDLDQEKISTSCGESGGPALSRCMCESYAPTRPPGLRSSRLPSTGYSGTLGGRVECLLNDNKPEQRVNYHTSRPTEWKNWSTYRILYNAPPLGRRKKQTTHDSSAVLGRTSIRICEYIHVCVCVCVFIKGVPYICIARRASWHYWHDHRNIERRRRLYDDNQMFRVVVSTPCVYSEAHHRRRS